MIDYADDQARLAAECVRAIVAETEKQGRRVGVS
jgi:hypothetical protein